MDLFVEKVKDLFGGENFPCSEEYFNQYTQESREEAREYFKQHAIGDSHSVFKELTRGIDKKLEEMKTQNIMESERILKDKLKKKFNKEFAPKLPHYADMQEMSSDIDRIYKTALEEGPHYMGYEKISANFAREALKRGAKTIMDRFKNTLSAKQKDFKEK